MAEKYFRRLLRLLLCVSLMLLLALPGRADFGDFSGSTDYDYSSSDSSYDYDYDDYDYDDTYAYGGSTYYDSGSSASDASDENVLSAAGILAICLVIWFVVSRLRAKRTGKKAPVRPDRPAAPRSLTPMDDYRKLDPDFRADDLTAKISNLYVQMQNGWTAKDISAIRPHCTDRFYTQMERQLEQKRQQHETNHVERIAVLGVTLDGFTQTGGNDVIYATVRTRIVDYTLNDDTGELVSGSRTQEKFMTYEWELVRQSGAKTQAEGGEKTVNCPNCGAPLELNASAKCPYCGSVITAESQSFVLNGIRGISQITG